LTGTIGGKAVIDVSTDTHERKAWGAKRLETLVVPFAVNYVFDAGFYRCPI